MIEERRRGTETARRRYELEQRVAAGCVVAKGPRKGEPMTSQGREQLARRLVRAAIDWHTANVRRVRLLAEFNRLRAGLPEESLGPRALYALSDPWARVEARFDREEGLA